MHLQGDDQRRPRKNRTGAEKFFKRANTFIVAIQLACFLISVSRVSIAADKTFKGSMFFPKEYELERVLQNKTGNCTRSFNEKFFNYNDVNLTVTPDNRGYFFARLAYRLRYVIGVNAGVIVVGGINKLIMDLNVYEFKYHQLIVHKEIITMIELVMLCFNLYQLSVAETWGYILREFLDACGVDSETAIPYVTPLVEMYFACSFALFCHVCTFVMHAVNASKKGGTTTEGVRAAQEGVVEMDVQGVQYDEYGNPVVDADGNPIYYDEEVAGDDEGWDVEEDEVYGEQVQQYDDPPQQQQQQPAPAVGREQGSRRNRGGRSGRSNGAGGPGGDGGEPAGEGGNRVPQ